MNELYIKLCSNLTYSWNLNNMTVPDLPKCFQYLDLPFYLFCYCLLCLFYVYWLSRSASNRRPYMKLAICKALLIVLLLGSQISELIYNIINFNEISGAFVLSNCCLIWSLLCMMCIVHVETITNALNSGFYFIFWLLLFGIYLIRTRSDGLSISYQFNSKSNYVSESFNFINLALVTISLVLSCLSDRLTDDELENLKKKEHNLKLLVDNENVPPEEIELKPSDVSNDENDESGVDKEKTKMSTKICPEYYSSFLNRISFLWFSPMVLKGYKQPLTQDDLWKLNEEDHCRHIVPKFQKFLRKYLKIDMIDSKDLTTNKSHNNAKSSSKKYEFKEDGDANKPTDDTKAALLTNNVKLDDNKSNNDSNNVKEENIDNNKIKSPAKKEKFDPDLLFTMLRCYWFELVVSGTLKLIHDCLTFSGPILLKWLLEFISSKDEPMWKGYMYAVLLLGSALIRSFILHQYFHLVFRIGMKVRTCLVSAVYRKSLVLSTWSRKESTVGEIVNLMSVDSQKFLELLSYVHMIWSGPFQIIVALVFLWMELGPSVLGGVAIMLLLIPINAVVGNLTRKIQTQQLKISDSRIKLMNEILNGIKVLKLYAWENSYNKFVTKIRENELHFMRKAAYLNAAIGFTFNCAPFLVSLTTFGIYVLVSSDNVLSAEKVFVSITLFNILRFPMMMLPMVIASLIQASVSLKRLTVFLKRNQIDENAINKIGNSPRALTIENGFFSWDPVSDTPYLKNINIEIPIYTLTAIVGPVGAGKSSLLSAALGEIHKCKGIVSICGSIAYVPQQAWIVNATVRDNIVFGLPFDSCKYHKILDACCLQRDLLILPQSDLTEIGEKGINLSGGQKQRISLARACYSDADVIILDDPLSAVDSHVAKDLMDNVLCHGGILENKSRVLVTHNLTVLPRCDRVVVLEQGSISEQGTYCQLIKHAGPFAKFVATHLTVNDDNRDICFEDSEVLEESERILEDIIESGAAKEDADIRAALTKSREKLHRSQENLRLSMEKVDTADAAMSRHSRQNSRTKDCNTKLKDFGIDVKKTGDKGKLIEEEVSKEGNVKLSVYGAYIRSIGWWLSILIILLFVATHAMNLASNLWLVRWSDQAKITTNYTDYLEQLKNDDATAKSNEIKTLTDYLNHQRDLNLGIYGLFGFAQVIFQLASSIVFAYGYIRAAYGLHRGLLNGVFRSPMTLFETVPLGRILNRFSSDLNAISTLLPGHISGFLWTSLSAFSVLILVILPNIWITIPLAFIMVAYVLMQRFYVATSRQLKRLESVSKSPIYSHFGETLQGVTSIRAYSLNEQFITASETKVDTNLYAYYANIVSNRWLAVILECIGNLIVFLAAMFSVVSLHYGIPINAGLVGLSVSYALSITQTLNWLVRMSSEVETNIVSVERIEEYTHMKPEAPWEIPDKKPNDDWPNGAIEFRNYSTRYRENLDLVLKNISLRVEPQEKVGIVGRTGSGKSSLVLALFRILERVDGEILIDGLPIHELGLHDVRSRLTIIPQDPVLFSGSLRNNIDPFELSTDEELWNVLELANLKEFIVEFGGVEQLDMVISEGGENLSVGQRQLVCLARALLRKTRILILDEATAAVDLDTDALIQTTIRDQFRNCTILTIAHRLNTVLDYDRIMVLDQGHVVETDSPGNLLNNSDSLFYSMAKDANLV